jgi:hypothetical protein
VPVAADGTGVLPHFQPYHVQYCLYDGPSFGSCILPLPCRHPFSTFLAVPQEALPLATVTWQFL